jgi:hypothetical protein
MAGPVASRTLTTAPKGTIAPAAFRTFSFPMSVRTHPERRVRLHLHLPVAAKRVKSLAYDDPRYTCSVLNTSSSETPSVFACVRFRRGRPALRGPEARGRPTSPGCAEAFDDVLGGALEPVGPRSPRSCT